MVQKKIKVAAKRTASERKRTLIRLFGSTPAASKLSSGVLSSLYWAFRRFHYWLCFYDNDVEIDMEDLLTNPFNTQPPSLEELERLTGFRREWIMFLYRNFKQICANGRMSQAQWRQIFRLIFKGASDYEFANRIFMAIAGNRTQALITFEDLIFCLYDLIQSFRCSNEDVTPTPVAIKRRRNQCESPQNRSCLWDQFVTQSAECSFDECGITETPLPSTSASMGALVAAKRWPTVSPEEKKLENPVPSTTTAQFTFSLMQPDSRGLVDETAFLRYTKCIFDLNTSVASSSNMTTFGIIQQMNSSNGGGARGLEESVSYSQSSSSHSNEQNRFSKRKKSDQMTFVPWQEAIAKQQFRALDSDNDGFITLADIQRLFNQRAAYEPLVLQLEAEIVQNTSTVQQQQLQTRPHQNFANNNKYNKNNNNKNEIPINVN